MYHNEKRSCKACKTLFFRFKYIRIWGGPVPVVVVAAYMLCIRAVVKRIWSMHSGQLSESSFNLSAFQLQNKFWKIYIIYICFIVGKQWLKGWKESTFKNYSEISPVSTCLIPYKFSSFTLLRNSSTVFLETKYALFRNIHGYIVCLVAIWPHLKS